MLVLNLIIYKLYAMNDSILAIVKSLAVCNLIFKTQDISILIKSCLSAYLNSAVSFVNLSIKVLKE